MFPKSYIDTLFEYLGSDVHDGIIHKRAKAFKQGCANSYVVLFLYNNLKLQNRQAGSLTALEIAMIANGYSLVNYVISVLSALTQYWLTHGIDLRPYMIQNYGFWIVHHYCK